jgi:hypothetical protein
MQSCRASSIAFTVVLAGLAVGQTPQTQAARAPSSPKELLAESDVIVVAEVTEIDIQKERARIETGFGNYDWAIYLTLRVQEVEKGTATEAYKDIVVRCFLIKTRKSAVEYFTRGGHYPIPEIGQTVRRLSRLAATPIHRDSPPPCVGGSESPPAANRGARPARERVAK